jgi:hypothetical protein
VEVVIGNWRCLYEGKIQSIPPGGEMSCGRFLYTRSFKPAQWKCALLHEEEKMALLAETPVEDEFVGLD